MSTYIRYPNSSGSSSVTTLTSLLNNFSFNTSVAANALTVTFLTNDTGANPSTGDAVSIGFRNTAAPAGSTVVQLTSAYSFTVPSGATLGTPSATSVNLFIYAINNAGTIKGGISFIPFTNENSLVTTVALSAGSTANNVLYSDGAYSNVAFRLVGMITVSEATAGTWASNATNLVVWSPFMRFPLLLARYHVGANHNVLTGTSTVLNYDTMDIDNYNCVTTGVNWTFTVPIAGNYECSGRVLYDIGSWGAAGQGGWIWLYKNGSAYNGELVQTSTGGTWQVNPISAPDIVPCVAGDTLQFQGFQNSGSTSTISNSGHCACVIRFLSNF